MLHTCVERFDVTGTVEKILGTKRGLSQALRVQEQMFVWFACLSDLAPRVQDSPRSQALQKRRNRPYLPGLSHLVQVSLNPCTVREIEIHGRDEPNNSCYWPGWNDSGNQTRCCRMHTVWAKLAWLTPCEPGSAKQRTIQALEWSWTVAMPASHKILCTK